MCNKFSECKDCNRTRRLKNYHESKDKKLIQQKIYYEKKRDKILVQKQNNRHIQIKGLARFYVELENKLKALEEEVDKRSNDYHFDGFKK